MAIVKEILTHSISLLPTSILAIPFSIPLLGTLLALTTLATLAPSPTAAAVERRSPQPQIAPHRQAKPLTPSGIAAEEERASRRLDEGRLDEAEPLLLQILDAKRQQFGDRSTEVAASLNQLFILYYAQGRYAEAEPLASEALDIRRQQLGEQHADVAQSLNNLAEFSRVQGRYEAAEPLYLQALEIYRQVFGDRHPEVATSLNNLG